MFFVRRVLYVINEKKAKIYDKRRITKCEKKNLILIISR